MFFSLPRVERAHRSASQPSPAKTGQALTILALSLTHSSAMGLVGGSIWHGIKGARSSPKVRWRLSI